MIGLCCRKKTQHLIVVPLLECKGDPNYISSASENPVLSCTAIARMHGKQSLLGYRERDVDRRDKLDK